MHSQEEKGKNTVISPEATLHYSTGSALHLIDYTTAQYTTVHTLQQTTVQYRRVQHPT